MVPFCRSNYLYMRAEDIKETPDFKDNARVSPKLLQSVRVCPVLGIGTHPCFIIDTAKLVGNHSA